MSKKLDRPSRPRHVRIWDEDWEFLEMHFGRNSRRPIGSTKAIRSIVHSWIERLKAAADTEPEIRRQAAQAESEEG